MRAPGPPRRALTRMRTLAMTLGVLLAGSCDRAPPVPPPASPTPAEQLSAMDPRSPVPLLPMMAHHQKRTMQDHLLAVQQTVDALGRDDFAAARDAAARLGSSPQMLQMCEHMGAGAPGFTSQAKGFHATADTLVQALEVKDRAASLQALSATLQTCVGCHATWKQELVAQLPTPEKRAAP